MKTIYLGENIDKFEWYWYSELRLKCKEYNITIGENVRIRNNVRIGNNVTIGDNVNIYDGAEIPEDEIREQ